MPSVSQETSGGNGSSSVISQVMAALSDRPPPPPGLVEMPPRVDPAGGTPARRRQWSVTLCPQGLAWVPVIALTLTLLLTFFPWVGIYPGGIGGYVQSPWGAMVGNFTSDHVVEDLLKLEGRLRERISWDWMMVPYLLGLLLAVFLAACDRFLPSAGSPMPSPLVAWLGSIWTQRARILPALAGALLALLVIQWLAGFSLENAIRKEVASTFAEARQQAGNVSAEQKKIDIREDMVLASYRLGHTLWCSLALAAQAIAVLALLANLALEARGKQPPPRIILEY